jgi:hypothetical protein
MTTVGIVGGLGPESTIDYYRRILEAWDDPSSAPSIVIDSLDVKRALRLVESDRPGLTEYLLASLHRLAGAGVDFAAMSANTPHIVFDSIASVSSGGYGVSGAFSPQSSGGTEFFFIRSPFLCSSVVKNSVASVSSGGYGVRDGFSPQSSGLTE